MNEKNTRTSHFAFILICPFGRERIKLIKCATWLTEFCVKAFAVIMDKMAFPDAEVSSVDMWMCQYVCVRARVLSPRVFYSKQCSSRMRRYFFVRILWRSLHRISLLATLLDLPPSRTRVSLARSLSLFLCLTHTHISQVRLSSQTYVR